MTMAPGSPVPSPCWRLWPALRSRAVAATGPRRGGRGRCASGRASCVRGDSYWPAVRGGRWVQPPRQRAGRRERSRRPRAPRPLPGSTAHRHRPPDRRFLTGAWLFVSSVRLLTEPRPSRLPRSSSSSACCRSSRVPGSTPSVSTASWRPRPVTGRRLYRPPKGIEIAQGHTRTANGPHPNGFHGRSFSGGSFWSTCSTAPLSRRNAHRRRRRESGRRRADPPPLGETPAPPPIAGPRAPPGRRCGDRAAPGRPPRPYAPAKTLRLDLHGREGRVLLSVAFRGGIGVLVFARQVGP